VDEIKGIIKLAMEAVSLNAENADLEALAEVSDLEITESDEEDYDYEI